LSIWFSYGGCLAINKSILTFWPWTWCCLWCTAVWEKRKGEISLSFLADKSAWWIAVCAGVQSAGKHKEKSPRTPSHWNCPYEVQHQNQRSLPLYHFILLRLCITNVHRWWRQMIVVLNLPSGSKFSLFFFGLYWQLIQFLVWRLYFYGLVVLWETLCPVFHCCAPCLHGPKRETAPTVISWIQSPWTRPGRELRHILNETSTQRKAFH
jgi:hypothetical protein